MAATASGPPSRSVGLWLRDPRVAVAIDAMVATALFLIFVLTADRDSVVTHVGPFAHAVRIAGLAAACAMIPVRRRYPWPALAAATLAAVVALSLGGPGPVSLCIAVTAYTAATTPTTASWWAPPAVTAVAVAAAVTVGQAPRWVTSSFAWPAVVCVGWFVGLATRERRSRLAAAAERRDERDRQRAADLRQAALDERLVIARELHDVVAHAMSVIAVRAGVARVVMDHDPVEVKETLGIIETTTRRALQEMRLLVGVLRRDGDLDADLVPAPGIGDLDSLIEQMRRAGVDVTLHMKGPRRILPAGVDLSAYRIVQEALTNVVRHVGPTTVELSIAYRPDDLTIEVVDAGPADSGPPTREHRTEPRHGLIGMAERVALFDGHLDAARHGAGFRVHALLRTDQQQS